MGGLLLVSCNRQASERPSTERPATKRDVLWIEGTPESTTFILQTDKAALASFYVPNKMANVVGAGGWGYPNPTFSAIRLGPDFSTGTYVVRLPTISIFVGENRKQSKNEPDLRPPSNVKLIPRNPRRYRWTDREFDLTGDWLPRDVGYSNATGQILFGRHSGKWFHITEYYPVEMRDRLAPSHRAILDSWIWTDTGRPLNDSLKHR